VAHDLRFQVMCMPDAPAGELVDRVRRLEELGLDVAGIADHFVDWLNPDGPWFECWTTLAAVAARTSTIRLASCVAQIPLRNPAMLARQAMTVDHVSGGRLEVGLGAGLTADPSYPMAGLPTWSGAERVARFGEYVQVVDLLLSSARASYAGRFYPVADARMSPGPVQRPRPPLTVAANSPRMLRHAVAHADTWNTLSFAGAVDDQLAETRDRVGQVRRLCAQAGRDPATLRFSYTMFDASARANGSRIAYYDSPELLVDIARRAVGLGMSELVLYYPADPRQLPAFEAVARDVLPELRRKYPGWLPTERPVR
jgi:alkanesulfonate monooxygenase SsuD/methylene tetrahydromethanopterin reductase-like flavin-dependent oxidoreductase (luciferase family)